MASCITPCFLSATKSDNADNNMGDKKRKAARSDSPDPAKNPDWRGEHKEHKARPHKRLAQRTQSAGPFPSDTRLDDLPNETLVHIFKHLIFPGKQQAALGKGLRTQMF